MFSYRIGELRGIEDIGGIGVERNRKGNWLRRIKIFKIFEDLSRVKYKFVVIWMFKLWYFCSNVEYLYYSKESG